MLIQKVTESLQLTPEKISQLLLAVTPAQDVQLLYNRATLAHNLRHAIAVATLTLAIAEMTADVNSVSELHYLYHKKAGALFPKAPLFLFCLSGTSLVAKGILICMPRNFYTARKNFVFLLAPLIKATFSCFYSAESLFKTILNRFEQSSYLRLEVVHTLPSKYAGGIFMRGSEVA